MNQNKFNGDAVPEGQFSLESILEEYGAPGQKPADGKPVVTSEKASEPVGEEMELHWVPVAVSNRPSEDPEETEDLPLEELEEPSLEEPEACPEENPTIRVPQVTPEELAVDVPGGEAPEMDVALFDKIYQKRQRQNKALKQEMLWEERYIRREAKRYARRNRIPSDGKPIPIPAGAKAELEKERRDHPVGQRFRKKTVKPVDVAALYRSKEKEKRSAGRRLPLMCLVLAATLYLAAANPLRLPLPQLFDFYANPRIYAAVSGGLLLAGALLNGKSLIAGLEGVFLLRGKPESLLLCSVLSALGYSIQCAIQPHVMANAAGELVYAPVTVVPTVTLFTLLLASRLRSGASCRILRSALKIRSARVIGPMAVPFDGEPIYAMVRAEELNGFYHTFTEQDQSEQMMNWYAPLMMTVSLFLSVFCVFSVDRGTPFLWAWSLISAFLPALGLFLGTVLPYRRISRRLLKNGVLPGGSRSLYRTAKRTYVALTDEDLFPPEAVSLSGARIIMQERGDEAISITASMLKASGSALMRPFLRMAEQKYIGLLPVTDLKLSDFGGLSGTVEERKVLVGTAEFVDRYGIEVPADIKLKTAVFCAVDGELLAVFAVKYQVQPKNDYALTMLISNGYKPVIATRDFNITPEFIRLRFGLLEGDVIYPKAEERQRLSRWESKAPSDGLVVTYGGSDVMAQALTSCSRYRSAVRTSLAFSLLSSLIGLLYSVLMAYFGWGDVATSMNMLLYYLLWLLPTVLFSGWVNWF